jgi:general stress protein YciG
MSKRGFASMDREKLRELARRGGKAAHAQGKAHEWTSEEASAMGRRGGLAVSANRAHMRELSRLAHEQSAKAKAPTETSGS